MPKNSSNKCRKCGKLEDESAEHGFSVYGYCDECHMKFLEILRAIQRFSDDK